MTTFGRMVKRISRESRKDGSTADIKASIQEAIEHYSSDRFWFNEGEATAHIGSGAISISYPTNFKDIDTLEISSTPTDRLSLLNRSIEEIRQGNSSPTYSGIPWKYATFRERLWFTPPSDRSYEVKVFGQLEVTGISASSSDNATNAWMVEAEEMIREKAASYMWSKVWRNQSQAGIAELRAESFRRKLKGETDNKISTGRVERSRF